MLPSQSPESISALPATPRSEEISFQFQQEVLLLQTPGISARTVRPNDPVAGNDDCDGIPSDCLTHGLRRHAFHPRLPGYTPGYFTISHDVSIWYFLNFLPDRLLERSAPERQPETLPLRIAACEIIIQETKDNSRHRVCPAAGSSIRKPFLPETKGGKCILPVRQQQFTDRGDVGTLATISHGTRSSGHGSALATHMAKAIK